ncbi:MAG: hypothetical protein M1828_005993 [Chrysothrix sp. TS-e1954]|nr:MAG: hypothetical protein M1828_005993 [Chrysothrix sp. TS-e1954]
MTSTTSTEPPTQLRQGLRPVPIKYIPLPIQLPASSEPGTAYPTTTATESTRPPCRRCLLDAQPGEQLHLLAYDPFPAESTSPYRGSGPIFVHVRACGRFVGRELPERQLRRRMSVRAYDGRDYLVASELVVGGGEELERVAGGMLADETARYLNVFNAGPGCFAVRIERERL